MKKKKKKKGFTIFGTKRHQCLFYSTNPSKTMGFERKRQARDHCDHIGTDFFFFFQKEREIRRRL